MTALPAPRLSSCRPPRGGAPGPRARAASGLSLLGKAIAQLGLGLAGISCGGDVAASERRPSRG